MNDVPEGAYILEVVAGSPAEKAGIQNGDIITNIDSTRLSGANAELSTVISGKKVGDSVSLSVWRDGKTLTLKATLATQ
jgi:serine protease Do